MRRVVVLFVLTVSIALARVVLAVADPRSSSSATDPRVPGGGVAVAVFEAAVLIAIAGIGALVASRQPRNPIGWILCVIALSLGLLVLSSHAFWSLALAGHARAAELTAWVASWIWVPAMVAALTLFPLLFPTGRPPTPRWRPVARLAVTAGALLLGGVAFTPGRFEDYPVDNPFPGGVAAEVASWTGFALLLCTALASLASIIVRFRRSHGEERQQLKWVTAAVALFVLVFALPTEQVGLSEELGFGTLLLGLLLPAAATGVAILRYRLYDIDVVINRALVYVALTATLAATYVSSVLLLQLALKSLTAGSNLAVAASTLAVAALFRPARTRIQRAVDHRFFRRRYDAERTLEAFSNRLRDHVDLATLDAELGAVVRETLQPAHVSLWLRDRA